MASSALSMLAGILARPSVWLLQFFVRTGRGPASLIQTFQERLRCSLACLCLLGASAFLPLLAGWEWQRTSQRAETRCHSRVASPREQGDSTAGRGFYRKSLGSVCVWLRRLAHFREKLQSPCKNFSEECTNWKHTRRTNTWVKKKKKTRTFFLSCKMQNSKQLLLLYIRMYFMNMSLPHLSALSYTFSPLIIVSLYSLLSAIRVPSPLYWILASQKLSQK